MWDNCVAERFMPFPTICLNYFLWKINKKLKNQIWNLKVNNQEMNQTFIMHTFNLCHLDSVHLTCVIAVMEKFTENTRFCLICNYLTKIIPALQSRCTRFRFGPLDNEQMTTRLEHVIKTEGWVCCVTFSLSNFKIPKIESQFGCSTIRFKYCWMAFAGKELLTYNVHTYFIVTP